MKRLISVLLVSLLVLVSSCKENKREGSGFKGYDSAVLKNWVNNIIIPSFENYQTKLEILATSAEKFENEANQVNLDEIKNNWLSAYKAFQKTMLFDLSKNGYYLNGSNSFPANTEKINNNISKIEEKGEDSVSMFATLNTSKGFPALDYLLFAPEKDLQYYKNTKTARTYLKMVATTLKEAGDRKTDQWKKNKDKYANSTDQSSSGEYSKTVNAFIRVYEKQIRAQKVGYATGAIPIQDGVAIPKYIEAYYKGDISKELLTIALKSSQDFFNGNYFNGQGQGKSLNTILKEMGKEDLVNKINSQYEVIYKTIENTPKTLKVLAEEGVSESDFTKRPLYKIYADIQKNVGNYKTKMLAALNVSTNYQDTDGD